MELKTQSFDKDENVDFEIRRKVGDDERDGSMKRKHLSLLFDLHSSLIEDTLDVCIEARENTKRRIIEMSVDGCDASCSLMRCALVFEDPLKVVKSLIDVSHPFMAQRTS